MNIFADFHHSSLFYSYHLTLEKRLGYKVFRPVGMEWAHEGWWMIHKPYNFAEDTARQYLDLDQRYVPKDGTPKLNVLAKRDPIKDAYYEISEIAHGYTQKAITLDQFKSMDIDIIIASIPDHAITFKKLRDRYHPKAKLIFQMGNMFVEIERLIKDGYIENLLASVKPFQTTLSHDRVLFYHQEIDQTIFKYSPPVHNKIISSFVIGLPKCELFQEYRKMLTEFDFRAYASQELSFMQSISEIAYSMAQSDFAWHIKPSGDGFGHVLYDWAFIGRPIITDFSDYQDKLGGEILVDGLTAIDIGRGSIRENVDRIRQLSTKDNLSAMSYNIKNRIASLVDYDKESKQVDEFIRR